MKTREKFYLKIYTELVKKFNVVDKENSILREENRKLRKKLDERKDNNQTFK